MEPKISYSYKTAAAATGVSASGIRKAVSAGELRAVRLGGRVLIPAPDLKEWWEKQTRPYTKPEPQAA